MKEWMKQDTRINGWDFEYVENDHEDRFFQCRGDVMYDDDHDEMPEPGAGEASMLVPRSIVDAEMAAAGFRPTKSHDVLPHQYFVEYELR